MRDKQKKSRSLFFTFLISILMLGTVPSGAVAQATGSTHQAEDRKSSAQTNKEDLIPIDEAHFGETFRYYIAHKWDRDRDGYLSKAERERPTYVQIDPIMPGDAYYVVDFKGLEYFPNMKKIFAGRSDGEGGFPLIRNLDTSKLNLVSIGFYGAKMEGGTLDLSKSSQAEYIRLGGSELASVKLPKKAPHLRYLNLNSLDLSTLEISGYPALKELYARYSGHYPTLDLSQNAKLETLWIQSSRLTELDLTGLTELKSLDVKYSPIREIDLTYNRKLERLILSDTEIHQLDISHLDQLTTLWALNNHLATLEVGNQKKLTDLGLNLRVRFPTFSGIPSETIEGGVRRNPATHQWEVDFRQWMTPEERARVSMKEYVKDWTYDPKTGIATYLKTEPPTFLDYKYETKSVQIDNWSKNTAMYVRAQLKKTYQVSAEAGKGGQISPSGNQTYLEGEAPVYTVTPDPGYILDQVQVDGQPVSLGEGNTYTFSDIASSHTIDATFRALPVITATAGEGGTVSPSGVQAYPFGETATYTFQPQAGYQVKEVRVDGQPVVGSPLTSYTFSDIQANHQLQVIFEEKTKIGSLESPNQLTRSLQEVEDYLRKYPTETVTSYLRQELQAKGYYVYEGETVRHPVPVSLDVPGLSVRVLRSGTYKGILSLDPSVWKGTPVHQSVEIRLTEEDVLGETSSPENSVAPPLGSLSDIQSELFPRKAVHTIGRDSSSTRELPSSSTLPHTGDSTSDTLWICLGGVLFLLMGAFCHWWRLRKKAS
ncbi:InlB B-repeat-containing protein [Listeria kieliensis]|uniref:Bacterial repeat domain-containing protein n=1 Tax=Listeria kieliensis TaxID=1621700 RepID=A0A3D8TTW3_9LIST|nr:leucine-rich repeat domain-containing protein [Listeria kieliensis]RDX02087.1 hypothetical protein UR08_00675 [Listeria kieliensis]